MENPKQANTGVASSGINEVVTTYWQRLQNIFTAKTVPAAAVGYLRVVVGLALLYDLYRSADYLLNWLPYSEFFFGYDGFDWIKPLAQPYMSWYVYGCVMIYGLLVLGLWYRPVVVVAALCQWYFLLMDRSNYNNHFYLYALITTLLVFCDGAKGFSVPSFFSSKSYRLPAWQLIIFKLQISIVYMYGAFAKINHDWLQGYPMRYWLDGMADEINVHVIADFLRTQQAAYIYSWTGLFFDFSVAILLWVPKARKWLLPFLLFFHISNHYFFNIGNFPWVMIALTLIFFNPERIFSPKIKSKGGNKVVVTSVNSARKKNVVTSLICVYLLFQLLFPLRRWYWGTNPSWTGQGHLFAWRMMLVESVEGMKIRIRVPDEGVDFYVDMGSYINQNQFRKGMRTPTVVLKFIETLKNKLRENGVLNKADIHLEMYKSVNFRPPVLFNDTTLNYANIEYHPFERQKWIMPYNPDTVPLEFHKYRYKGWGKLVEDTENSY